MNFWIFWTRILCLKCDSWFMLSSGSRFHGWGAYKSNPWLTIWISCNTFFSTSLLRIGICARQKNFSTFALCNRNCYSLFWNMLKIRMQNRCLRSEIFKLLFLPVVHSPSLLYIFSKFISMQGLLEARQELRPLLFKPNARLKDLLFLDIALDSTVRTAVERGYEELNKARPEVHLNLKWLHLLLDILKQ